MKTTVKTDRRGAVIVEKQEFGDRVILTIEAGELDWGEGVAVVELTQDQAGVLIFGLEQAAEAARIAAERDAMYRAKYDAKTA